VAAAAVLMAGMRRMAVDGLESGDAGHVGLREAGGFAKVAESSDVDVWRQEGVVKGQRRGGAGARRSRSMTRLAAG